MLKNMYVLLGILAGIGATSCGGGGGQSSCQRIQDKLTACGLLTDGIYCAGAQTTPTDPTEVCFFNCIVAASCPELDAVVCQNDPTLIDACNAACPVPTFDCGDGTTIRASWQCDGFSDCNNGSDEQNCPMFTCTSGDMILERGHCDGFGQCQDGSDEEGCPDGTSFLCGSGERIPPSWQCDTDNDCTDASDEANCPDSAFFICGDGTRIRASWQCDGGTPDCTDGSDEVGCAELICA